MLPGRFAMKSACKKAYDPTHLEINITSHSLRFQSHFNHFQPMFTAPKITALIRASTWSTTLEAASQVSQTTWNPKEPKNKWLFPYGSEEYLHS